MYSSRHRLPRDSFLAALERSRLDHQPQQPPTNHPPFNLITINIEPPPAASVTHTTTANMFSSSRTRLTTLSRSTRLLLPRTYTASAPRLSSRSDNPIPTNDPNPPAAVTPQVSETNVTPTDAMGGKDGALQESTQHAIHVLENQAPNRKTTWAQSQQERAVAMSGPRFEQTIMEYQVRMPWGDVCGWMGWDILAVLVWGIGRIGQR